MEHGSAAAFFAAYPVSDQIGLMDLMKKRGSRLGGTTGQLALRFMGKESFILTGDVVNALSGKMSLITIACRKKIWQRRRPPLTIGRQPAVAA